MTAAIHFINIYFVSFPFSSFPVPSGIRLNLTFNILLLSTSSTWKRYSLKSIISLRRGKSPFISNKRPAKVSTSSVNLPKSEGSASITRKKSVNNIFASKIKLPSAKRMNCCSSSSYSSEISPTIDDGFDGGHTTDRIGCYGFLQLF